MINMGEVEIAGADITANIAVRNHKTSLQSRCEVTVGSPSKADLERTYSGPTLDLH